MMMGRHAIMCFILLLLLQLMQAIAILGAHNGRTTVPQIRSLVIALVADAGSTTFNRWQLQTVLFTCGDHRCAIGRLLSFTDVRAVVGDLGWSLVFVA